MKTRQGFVSNSSTSSFIIVGVVLAAQEVKKYEDPETGVLRACPKGFDLTYTDGDKYILGITLADASSDGDYIPDMEFSIEELAEKRDMVREATGKEPKLYMGTRSS